jgi:hypothetical protein
MPLDARVYAADVIAAIELIEQFTRAESATIIHNKRG